MCQVQAQQAFESQKVKEVMSQAEKEEIEVRRRRAEGTPCTKENFENWKQKFEAEMAKEAENKDVGNGTMKDKSNNKKKAKPNVVTLEEQMAGRLTGFEQFNNKKGSMDMDLLEKAAEEAAAGPADEDEEVDVDDLDVDEDLFDDDDDLDDLDFDDSDEDSDDDIDI